MPKHILNTNNHPNTASANTYYLPSDGNKSTYGLMRVGLILVLLFSFIQVSPTALAKSPANITGSTAPKGTPVAVVQKALEALYHGDTSQAASYYHISDIPNFEAELESIQPVFTKTVSSISFTEIFYNKTGDKAAVIGNIRLIEPTTQQEKTDSVMYKLIKINGEWKIVN